MEMACVCIRSECNAELLQIQNIRFTEHRLGRYLPFSCDLFELDSSSLVNGGIQREACTDSPR